MTIPRISKTQIATSNDEDNIFELPSHQCVSGDIFEEPKGTLV